jgi:hypothetical protein
MVPFSGIADQHSIGAIMIPISHNGKAAYLLA